MPASLMDSLMDSTGRLEALLTAEVREDTVSKALVMVPLRTESLQSSLNHRKACRLKSFEFPLSPVEFQYELNIGLMKRLKIQNFQFLNVLM